jgi:hypothetical protein
LSVRVRAGRKSFSSLTYGALQRFHQWVPDAPAWLAFAYLLVLTLQIHLRLILPNAVYVGSDEGYIAAFAHRMLDHGMLPFVDAVSHRGPLLYWLAAGFVAVFGSGWLPMRVASLVMHLLTAVLTFACGVRANRALSGAMGVVVFALCCWMQTHRGDGYGFNGEYALNVFAIGGMLCVICALTAGVSRRSCLVLVMLGAMLTSLGALCKQVGALHHLPLFAWVAAAASARVEWPPRARVALLGAYAAGALSPLAVVIVIYAVAGELRALHYWSILYNTRVYMRGFPSRIRVELRERWVFDHLALFTALLPIGAVQLVRSLRLAQSPRDFAKRYAQDGFAITVTLQAVVAAIAVQAGLRFWGHYYAQLAPWIGLALGAALEPLPRSARRGVVQLAALVPAVGLFWFAYRQRIDEWQSIDATNPKICQFIGTRVGPEERLFVWGFGADLYVSCRRKPASRFVFTGPAVGYLANLPEKASPAQEAARAAPGGPQTLLADLEEARPPLIINSLFHDMRPMQDYPEFAALLARDYCAPQNVEGHEVFVRKRGTQSCEP